MYIYFFDMIYNESSEMQQRNKCNETKRAQKGEDKNENENDDDDQDKTKHSLSSHTHTKCACVYSECNNVA